MPHEAWFDSGILITVEMIAAGREIAKQFGQFPSIFQVTAIYAAMDRVQRQALSRLPQPILDDEMIEAGILWFEFNYINADERFIRVYVAMERKRRSKIDSSDATPAMIAAGSAALSELYGHLDDLEDVDFSEMALTAYQAMWDQRSCRQLSAEDDTQ